MLTATLRGLERDGYAARRTAPTKPPNVHYCLTPPGCQVVEPVRALALWALSHMETIRVARIAYDTRASG